MNSPTLTPLAPNQAWPREYLLRMLHVATSVNEYSFARRTSLGWLSTYSGDLSIQFLHALALWEEGRSEQALSALTSLCQSDPEMLEAQKLLVLVQKKQNRPQMNETWGIISALAPRDFPLSSDGLKNALPAWSKKVAKARLLMNKDRPSAAQNIQEAMVYELETSFAAVTHLRVMEADPETPVMAMRNLSEYYHEKWPEALVPALILADSFLKSGQPERGVDLLHKASTRDVTGQVARRLWGEEHPYRDLWPQDLRAHVDVRVPARVSAALGWNLLARGEEGGHGSNRGDNPHPDHSPHPNPLPGGEGTRTPAPQHPCTLAPQHPSTPTPQDPDTSAPQHPRSSAPQHPSTPAPSHPTPSPQIPPETLVSIQKELEKAAQRLGYPKIAKRDGRFPMYVMFSSRRGLEKKYGPKTTQILRDEMEKYASAVREKPNWGAVTIFVDDAGSMAKFGLKPVRSYGAWEFKLALADLDSAFAKKGLMIGALLIVGGPEVVPFHRLPNPVEDVDVDVPSDNPYATRDENYFIPEWPVGRLPGGAGRDPGPLLIMLRKGTSYHQTFQKQKWWKSVWEWFVGLFFYREERQTSLGYAAEAWKTASWEVFRSIGDKDDLVTSPPYGRKSEIPEAVTRLGYFNLHGVEDNSPWYGQRDMTRPSEGTAYPVALSPEDIRQEDEAPWIVFSEACYGTHLENRAVEESLALTFLDKGSRAVVGSTVTSYGSVAGPLIAADLLGAGFWRYLKQGYSSGEALQKSKIALARKMHKRQGYLDGEDQKTLISFVLYGDPLANGQAIQKRHPKNVERSQSPPPQVKTVCDRCELSENIPTDVLKEVKRLVRKHLPGMESGHLTISQEHGTCQGKEHTCPTSQFGAKSLPDDASRRRVVTIHKDVSVPQNGSASIHHHYARVTFDEQGKVVKVAVSR